VSGGHKLKPGRYQLVATPSAGGGTGTPKSARSGFCPRQVPLR
jgi:hypothetical protein